MTWLERWKKSEAQGAGRAPAEEIVSRIVADFSAKQLVANYRAIAALAKGKGVLPLIKANAYGHGAVWVAKALAREANLAGFGVATLDEGEELREALPKARIVVFSETARFGEAVGQYCEKHNLVATISSEESWRAFRKGGWPSRIKYELKFNTGMNRLGFNLGFLSELARDLRALPGEQHPDGVLSHLACAESPRHELSLKQVAAFRRVRSELASIVPSAAFHLANSAGIWNGQELGIDQEMDLVRPGISLYGATPWDGAPARGIAPVMHLQARVLATRALARNETIGYGATYVANDAMQVAVLAAGYGDGLPRALSSRGQAFVSGTIRPVIGVVSMDLSTIQCGPETRAGDWVELWGSRIDPWRQAKSAGTIPYELFTSLTARVDRRYG